MAKSGITLVVMHFLGFQEVSFIFSRCFRLRSGETLKKNFNSRVTEENLYKENDNFNQTVGKLRKYCQMVLHRSFLLKAK